MYMSSSPQVGVHGPWAKLWGSALAFSSSGTQLAVGNNGMIAMLLVRINLLYYIDASSGVINASYAIYFGMYNMSLPKSFAFIIAKCDF